MKKILYILLWIFIISGISFIIVIFSKNHSNSLCKGIEINIKYNNCQPIIYKDEILSKINNIYDSIEKIKISEINTEKINNEIKKNPYIDKTNVKISINGKLKIRIIQKNPIVRVINKKNQNMFIDIKGDIITHKPNHPLRLLIANGNINEIYKNKTNINNSKYKKTKTYKIYYLAKHIKENKFLNSQIQQIYINSKTGDIELLPYVGEHTIVFGDIDNTEEKLEKLIIFYKKGLRNIDWNKYKTLNLKYKHQVVCSKK